MKFFWGILFALVLCHTGLAETAPVNVGCQISAGHNLIYDYPEFAHQPYVMRITTENAEGQTRHFTVGVAFDNGNFTVRVDDDDHLIDEGGYSRATELATGEVTLAAPNHLTLVAGDSGTGDAVVQVKCTLTATTPAQN